MKKVLIFTICLLTFTSISMSVKAQNNTTQPEIVSIDLSKLPPEIASAIRLHHYVGKYENYIYKAKAVGIAINEGLNAVSDSAEKFAGTTPGKLTMFLIAYKVIGTDLLQLAIGILFAIIWTSIWYKSYKNLVLNNNENSFGNSRADFAAVHLGLALVLLAINLVVLFA